MPQPTLPSWDSVLQALASDGSASVSSLVRLSTDALYISRPTPFPLRDAVGRVLVRPGVTLVDNVRTRALLDRGLWVDPHDAGYGDHAGAAAPGSATPDTASPATQGLRANPLYWQALHRSVAALLQAPRERAFLFHLRELHDELLLQLDQHRDRTLLALSHQAAHANEHRGASHALLCAAVATLMAQRIPALAAPERLALAMAALTMDLSIQSLHDTLAQQARALTPEQRVQLDGHAGASARLLALVGVIEPHWLQAVAHHHDAASGPLAGRPRPLMLARLLQRVDTYAALLAPEAGRAALSPADAAQAAYHGEDGEPDEAGMLLVRTLGIYPPGCAVRLVNGDLAMVIRCGRRPQWPVVATIASREGLAPSTPVLRPTGDPEFGIVEALPPRATWRVPALAELLPLTA